MRLPDVPAKDFSRIIWGLERLRDESTQQAKHYANVGHKWRSPEYAETLARDYEQEAGDIESLRQVLLHQPDYLEGKNREVPRRINDQTYP